MPILVHAARLVRSVPRPALALVGLFSMAACARPAAPAPSTAASVAAPKREFYDTFEVRLKGLAPRWEHLRLGARRIRIEYDGARVTRWDQSGDSAAHTSTVVFPTPVFAFQQLHMIVRSLPLRAGYTAILPLYSEGTAELEHDTVTVTGAPGPGSRGWTVRFADPSIVSTYTLDPATREIVDYRVVQRAAKAELWWERAEE